MAESMDVRERWRQAAERWRARGDFVRTATAPVSRALISVAEPRPGETWLDVAAGIGDPASYLVSEVGTEGVVVATDLIPEMIETTRDLVTSTEPGGRLLAVAASAEAMPTRPGICDGATCRFGAMFFENPTAAAREILGTLRSGGRGAFAVWADSEQNPFFTEMNEALAESIPDLPTPDEDDPHVFRFAREGKLAEVLEAGGWAGVSADRLAFEMTSRLGHRELWDAVVGLSVELAELVKASPPDRVEAIRSSFEARVAPHFKGGTMRFPALAWIVTGRAP